MAPFSGFSNCFNGRQKDHKRPARFPWSESHPLFQAGTADTCGRPGMLPNDHLPASRYYRLIFLDLSWHEILSCSVFHYRLRRRSSMTGSSWKTGWFDGKKPPLQRWVSSLAVSTFFVVESLGLGPSKVPGPSPAPHPSYPGSWAWNGSSCCRSGTLFESCRRYCHRGESLDSSENLPPKLHQKATGIRRTRRASLGKSTRTSCKTECLRQLFPSRHGSKWIFR